MSPALPAALIDTLQAAIGAPLRRLSPISGGDSHDSYRLDTTAGGVHFLKLNRVDRAPVFKAEAAALQTLAASGAVRVPAVCAHGQAGGYSFLLLEHLALGGRARPRELGQQLAALHRHSADAFGFTGDNFIGPTPQPNGRHADWAVFWRERRLAPQLRLARQNGYDSDLKMPGAALLDAIPRLLAGHTPQPSLLHGDLWGGNHGYLADGTPVLFDPASYYGDRECDLAMAELFGGYPPEFFAAYRAAWPLPPGHAHRRTLYNLYHILNHANLFGGGYVGQARRMMQELLSA